jgi:hypothetical protein
MVCTLHPGRLGAQFQRDHHQGYILKLPVKLTFHFRVSFHLKYEKELVFDERNRAGGSPLVFLGITSPYCLKC